MTQNRNFANSGSFCLSLPFFDNSVKGTHLYIVILSPKPGFRHLICANIIDNGRYMIQNIILKSWALMG